MAAATKRRRVSAKAAQNASRKAGGIISFASVSKAGATTKSIDGKAGCVDLVKASKIEEIAAGRKRKFVDEERDAEEASTILSTSIKDRETKHILQQRPSKTQSVPKTPRKPFLSTSPEAIETPTKGARNLLDRLELSSKSPTRSSLAPNAPKLPQASSTTDAEALPIELLDLINLHAAFLTALSLYYAHNGEHSPADLRELCPNVARAWGKRKVIIEDIRRTLGVINCNSATETKHQKLSLSDYGHGKICIELSTGPGKKGRVVRALNENMLNEVFACALRSLWEAREATVILVSDFIHTLPLESLKICPSALKIPPSLAKGQRRLEDLKKGITIKKEDTAKENITLSAISTGTKPTLLERLRAKQLQQANLPAPLSKAELSRKAALQRIDEVVSILTILSTSSSIGQQRISFTLPTVLGKLRDSFKTPMSKSEGENCVKLLAEEIAPQWVKIVSMGKVDALVVNRDERPSEMSIKERVRSAS